MYERELTVPGPLPSYLKKFYETQVVIKNHSEKTAYEYTLNVALFFRYLNVLKGMSPERTDVSNITISELSRVDSDLLTEYLFYESKRGSGASARSNKLSALSAFYSFLMKEGLVSSNPAKDVERPKLPRKEPRYLTEAECRQLLDSILTSQKINSTRDYCIVSIFLHCGFRLSELHGINLEDVKSAVESDDSQKFFIVVRGKGDKERNVPFNDAVLGAIADYLPIRAAMDPEGNEKALFVSRQGGRLSREAIQVMVKRRLLEAGLDSNKLSTHKLRHTSATLMLRGGADIRSIQEVLGHASLSTTQIYTHIGGEEKRIAVESNPLNIKEDYGGR